VGTGAQKWQETKVGDADEAVAALDLTGGGRKSMWRRRRRHRGGARGVACVVGIDSVYS
jgi:hypothetical protein